MKTPYLATAIALIALPVNAKPVTDPNAKRIAQADQQVRQAINDPNWTGGYGQFASTPEAVDAIMQLQRNRLDDAIGAPHPNSVSYCEVDTIRDNKGRITKINKVCY
jgi:hypothetical protein